MRQDIVEDVVSFFKTARDELSLESRDKICKVISSSCSTCQYNCCSVHGKSMFTVAVPTLKISIITHCRPYSSCHGSHAPSIQVSLALGCYVAALNLGASLMQQFHPRANRMKFNSIKELKKGLP